MIISKRHSLVDLLSLYLVFIVFKAVEIRQRNSPTPKRQCVLAPLTLVIPEVYAVYESLVKTTFKIHTGKNCCCT